MEQKVENNFNLIKIISSFIKELLEIKYTILEKTNTVDKFLFSNTKKFLFRKVCEILSNTKVKCPWGCELKMQTNQLILHATNCNSLKCKNCDSNNRKKNYQDIVKKDEEIEKRRAERKKRRKERKKKAKQEEINTPKVEDSSPEETGKEGSS